jgi:hypothetical protein
MGEPQTAEPAVCATRLFVLVLCFHRHSRFVSSIFGVARTAVLAVRGLWSWESRRPQNRRCALPDFLYLSFVFIDILALFRQFLAFPGAVLQVGTARLLSQGYPLTPHGFYSSVWASRRLHGFGLIEGGGRHLGSFTCAGVQRSAGWRGRRCLDSGFHTTRLRPGEGACQEMSIQMERTSPGVRGRRPERWPPECLQVYVMIERIREEVQGACLTNTDPF